ncbi:hypothetical protein HRI96_01785 [Treponema parvum]|uniref:Lipoprotein-associated type-17 domain-containing protein n=1 Tax=Treponema parvum TaxID=138851 RepID=A0A975EXY5_9SPIR|nr:lipoprotein 17-related variable surface protein [Treponema parvum]QTQ11030.1 hypothetical protein HRI96_01785 [Treponema parvum]
MKRSAICLLPMLLAVLLTNGCQQASSTPPHVELTENPGTNPAVPQNPYELVEADVLEAFGLTKGKQSAFEAEQKITSGSSAVPAIVFTQKDVTAYDDEAGTFTVKVKGTKNGNPFDKEMAVNGFANPYASQPWSINSNDGKGELKLDEGIERNLSIEKYIAEAYPTIADFFKAPLAFSLANGTSVTLGDCDYYKLEATLAKEGTDKIKIVPVYTVKNHKKAADGSDTVTEKECKDFTRSKESLTKPYFTEKDVFDHILEKVKNDESFIKTDPGSFASGVYAFAMVAQVAGDIFDESKISHYVNLYATKGNGHLEIKDITAGVYNIRNGGIKADDYEGTLTVDYYIATKDLVAQAAPSAHEISKLHMVTRSGFKKIKPETVKNEFVFEIRKIGSGGGTKQKWLNRLINTVLIQKKEATIHDNYDNWFEINDTLTDEDSSGYYLRLNGRAYSNCKPASGNQFLLKTNSASEPDILVERLSLQKNKDEENLIISMQFMGKSDTVDISVKPESY